MRKIVEKYVEMPRPIRKTLWRIWHNLILNYDKDKTVVFLNYGYAGHDDEFKHFKLNPQDEYFKYPIQLYAHVARNHSFPGSHVLEVGSGRGGGASFLTRYFKPETYTAIDINSNTIKFCNKRHKVDGLKFIHGEAENLPFANESFDAVVNVESARCYGNIPKFFSEVKRVLKPGGKFLFADMIKPNDVEQINRQLAETGFTVVEKKDILPNVVNSLKLDSEARKKEIDSRLPKFMRKAFYEFAGVDGSNRFKAFETREIGYWSYTLQKQA